MPKLKLQSRKVLRMVQWLLGVPSKRLKMPSVGQWVITFVIMDLERSKTGRVAQDFVCAHCLGCILQLLIPPVASIEHSHTFYGQNAS